MAAVSAEVKRRATAAARALSRQGKLRSAYLFGSYAEGRADRWSDIDVAAFIEGVETWDLTRRAQCSPRNGIYTSFSVANRRSRRH